MGWIREIWRRIRSIGRREEIETGLDEEVRFHVDQQTRKNLRAGMSPEQARREALMTFGGVEVMKERTRDQFRPALLEDSVRDLRYGVRSLRRAPGFTALATVTLALGIGATTSVFGVVNGVLLRPLPYPDPDRLVAIWHAATAIDASDDLQISAGQFFTYREKNRTFEQFGLWSSGTATVTGLGEPEEVRSLTVTDGTLRALGVEPLIGRWFAAEDDTAGATPTVVLMHGYWLRRFGGDAAVIGRRITVNARPRTIIGVMPPRFRFLTAHPDLIAPFQFDRKDVLLGMFNYQAVARLRPGVTVSSAASDISRMLPIWLDSWPPPPSLTRRLFENARIVPIVRPLKEEVVGDVGSVLWILMGTIGIVLVIACANVANLLLVRAEGRQQELAVRAALGAGRHRIARELLMESLALGALGGAVGVVLTFAALRLLAVLEPAALPRLADITVDWTVLAFAFIVSLLSGLLFGLIPVARRAGPHMALVLRSGGRTVSDGRERHRARNTLVVLQVGLALVLLVASGLMIRTFQALRAVHPGFVADRVQLVRIPIPFAQVKDPEQVFQRQRDIHARILALPGVTAASFVSAAPMEPFPDGRDPVVVEGRTYADGEIPPIRQFKFVAPGFFATVGTPIVAGRDITWADVDRRRPVAILSENVARETWQHPERAIGKRIRQGTGPWREVIGVVSDVHDEGVHEPAPPIVYWPLLMADFWHQPVHARWTVTFTIRSSRAGSESFVKDIQRAVWQVDAGLPLTNVSTLSALYERSMARTSFTLVMLVIAAALALLLGIVGIYGVIAYAVTQRTREIGIRVALGAPHGQLRRMFMRQGVVLAALGTLCGLTAAIGLTRLMSSLLFGISPLDPATYVAVSMVLIASAALASYIPALRTTSVDPVEALRAE